MPQARYANVLQYIGRPFYDVEYDENGKAISWKSDFELNADGTPKLNADGVPYLKDGVEPLITLEIIEDALDRRSIKRWAWVYHDKDVYTEEDEIDPKSNYGGLIREGMPKFPHYHLVLAMPNKVDLNRLAAWLHIPVNFIDIPRGGENAFWDCVEYLTHENEKQQDLGKYRYSDDEVHANFDWREELDERKDLRKKYGKNPPKTREDKMKLAVLVDGLTLREAKEKDPLTYAKCASSLGRLRLDYLRLQPPPSLRINIYIDGKSGLGKTSLSRLVAEHLTNGDYFETGIDGRVTFEGYDGQRCIVWNEMRAATMVKNFSRQGVLEMLDSHPGRQTQQVKGSSVMLVQEINIINGIEPYQDFLDGLAGEYTDWRDGTEHKAEDKTQTYRRMPLIFCVDENAVKVLINKGFTDDSREFMQYVGYKAINMSLANTMRLLDGEARDVATTPILEAAVEAVETVKEHEGDKISDPALIPPELMPSNIPDYIPFDFAQYAVKNEETGRWYLPQEVIEACFTCEGQTEMDLLFEDDEEDNPFNASMPTVAAINPRVMVEEMKNYAADDIIAVADEIRAEREKQKERN